MQLQGFATTRSGFGRLELVQGLQDQPVIQRLVLDTIGVGLLEGAGQRVQHCLELGLLNI